MKKDNNSNTLKNEEKIYQELLDKILTFSDPPQILNTKKSLTELVSEGRGL